MQKQIGMLHVNAEFRAMKSVVVSRVDQRQSFFTHCEEIQKQALQVEFISCRTLCAGNGTWIEARAVSDWLSAGARSWTDSGGTLSCRNGQL